MPAQRVLITGGAGFIGSRLAASHLATGDDVHVVVRPRRQIPDSAIPAGATVARVQLDDLASMEKCLAAARPTIIYHLAGDTGRHTGIPHPFERAKLTGDLDNLLTLLTAACETRPSVVVRAGSLAEYGDSPSPAHEAQREYPQTPYTTAMVAGAHYVRMLQPRLPFRVLTARLALTYGPGQSDSFLIPWLVKRCVAGQPCDVRQPSCRRDLLFVDDAVAGLRALAQAELAGGSIVNLSTGAAPTMREVAEVILEVTGADPGLISFGTSSACAAGIATVLGAPDFARSVLGWSATTSLRDGLRQTAASVGQGVYA